MGVIAFSNPQSGLEQIQKSVEFLSLIHEIAHNPKIGDTIDELTQKLLESQEMDAKKKKELADAQEVIAQSKEFVDEFEKQKATHALKVKSDLMDIDSKVRAHQANVDNYERDKIITKAANEKAKKDSEEKLASAKKLFDEANIRSAKAAQSEKDLEVQKQNHINTVAAFERDKAATIAEFEARENEWQGKMKKLAEDQKAFEIRKKKFEEALKG